MLRWLTAGESHGPELVAILEGLPAGVPILPEGIQADLVRRTLGYGRGARQKFEQDELSISGGIRFGETTGAPVALRIGNTEWPRWVDVMSATPVDLDTLPKGRGAALTRPRPGHADLVGMQKYGFDEARNILERASARETAARVAPGAELEHVRYPLFHAVGALAQHPQSQGLRCFHEHRVVHHRERLQRRVAPVAAHAGIRGIR